MCLMSHQCFSCCFLLQLLACHKTKCKFLTMPVEKHKKQWQGTNFASTTAKVFFHGGEISTFSWFLKQNSKSHRQWQKQNTVQCCSWSPEWTNKQNKVWRNLCYPVVCGKKKKRLNSAERKKIGPELLKKMWDSTLTLNLVYTVRSSHGYKNYKHMCCALRKLSFLFSNCEVLSALQINTSNRRNLLYTVITCYDSKDYECMCSLAKIFSFLFGILTAKCYTLRRLTPQTGK